MTHETRKTQSLAGTWKANAVIATDLDFVRKDYDDSAWADIEVPGHWQTHPEFEHYPEKLIYRTKFDAWKQNTGGRFFLRFSGVFYFCRVWCNGKYLGEHTGYFAPFEFDVTDVIREEGNILAVFARCKKEKDLNAKTQIMGVFANWDCKPDEIQPGGIWNDIELIEKPSVCVEKQRVGDFEIGEDGSAATVVASFVLDGERTEALEIEWEIRPANFEGISVAGGLSHGLFRGGSEEIAFEASIPEAALWWPWDHGAQNLYILEIRLKRGDAVIDVACVRFGIRTVEMKNYIVRVNGRRIFCRGSNYAPANIRLSLADRELYERDIAMMADAGMNMIRVHAHVEKPEFYDVCDERGVLVWQDFPLQWFYSNEIDDQAALQIKQMAEMLYSHPSVAVWCCHNEPYKTVGEMSAADVVKLNRIQDYIAATTSIMSGNRNKDVLDEMLEESVRAVDESRPVVRHSGVPGFVRGGTDSHIYFGWYYGTMRMLKALESVSSRSFRFITEYGAQAYPDLETFIEMGQSPNVDDLDWEELQHKYMLQKKIMDKYVAPVKGGAVEEYIEVSQWYQARLVKYHNEFFRAMKYEPCGGAIHFMFNDCCPAVTWSAVDHKRRPKKSYDALKESFRPTHIMAEFPKRWYPCGETVSLRITVVNDRYVDYGDSTVKWAFYDENEKRHAEGIKTLKVGADSRVSGGRARWDTIGAPQGGHALVIKLFLPGIEEPIVNQYEFELRKK